VEESGSESARRLRLLAIDRSDAADRSFVAHKHSVLSRSLGLSQAGDVNHCSLVPHSHRFPLADTLILQVSGMILSSTQLYF